MAGAVDPRDPTAAGLGADPLAGVDPAAPVAPAPASAGQPAAPPPDLDVATQRLGPPRVWEFHIPMAEREFEMLDRTGADGRWQDATILIAARDLVDAPTHDGLGTGDVVGMPGAFVAIAKHWYPDGLYRYPSGTLRPGEGAMSGALREAAEETGLEVRLTRYLLATEGTFYLGTDAGPERAHPWRSHVFLAEPVSGSVEPVDVREIREARVVAGEDMLRTIHPQLLRHGFGGFRYRVGLQERALQALGVGTGHQLVRGTGRPGDVL